MRSEHCDLFRAESGPSVFGKKPDLAIGQPLVSLGLQRWAGLTMNCGISDRAMPAIVTREFGRALASSYFRIRYRAILIVLAACRGTLNDSRCFSIMKNKLLAASAAFVLLATLAACGSNDNTSAQDDVAHAEDSPPIANAEGAGTVEPKKRASESASATTVTSSSVLEAARENCIVALYESANRRRNEITVLESEPARTGATVSLMIDGAAAPWSCTTDDSGNVRDLYYSAKEG